MHFANDLYISENLLDKKKKIMNDIKYGRGFNNYYLIYKNSETGKPECMKSLYFRQKYFSSLPFLIEGIAETKQDALRYMALSVTNAMGVTYDN